MKLGVFACWTAIARQSVAAAAVAAIAAMSLAGCGEEEARTYSVPKGSEAIAAAGSPGVMPPQPGGAATSAGPDAGAPATGRTPWVVPEGWTEVPENPPMRLATYMMPGPEDGREIEVAISRFPGDVGGLLANVNRWRGQVGLPPIGDAELQPMIEHYDSPGFHGHLIHIEGPEQHMLAASIYEHATDETWFVRVVTDGPTAEWAREDVYAFARSFGTAGQPGRAATPGSVPEGTY